MTGMTVIDATTPVELGLADEVIAGLKGRLEGLKADTHQGYLLVRAAIGEVRTYRTGVEKARKALKASALDWGKKVDAEARRVTDLLIEIETPLKEEKFRIDDKADRLRKEKEEDARNEALAKECEEREAREAEEKIKREVECKKREAEIASLAAQRKILEEQREQLEAEQKELRESIEKERQAVAAEREAVEADKRAVEEEANKKRETIEEAERKVRAKAETERLAEERKPDREKLKDFGDKIQGLNAPQLKTDWGNGVLAKICDLLQSAVDVAYCSETDDELIAKDAAGTVGYQSPAQ